MSADDSRMAVTDDQNAFLMIGRTQAALKAVEDRQSRHEERFDAFLVENAKANTDMDIKLDTVIGKLTLAEGRSMQRTDDTARLTRQVGWLIAIAGLSLTLLGIFIEGHVRFYGH